MIALPLKLVNMIAVGFEPTKHDARELESLPFDRSGTLPIYQRSIIFGNSTLCGTRTHNPQIRSLMRYPVAPIGLKFLHHGDLCFLPKKDFC